MTFLQREAIFAWEWDIKKTVYLCQGNWYKKIVPKNNELRKIYDITNRDIVTHFWFIFSMETIKFFGFNITSAAIAIWT